MAASAQAGRSTERARQRSDSLEPLPRPRSRTRPRTVCQSRLLRAFIVFVLCLAVLAAGRVAMSFAVVQKTLATDAVACEERRLAAENAQLAEQLAHLGSTVRIRSVAQKKLGLVDASHVEYVAVTKGQAGAGSRP